MGFAFPDTQWSLLANLGEKTVPERVEVLRWFAHQYWKPVRAYIRSLRREAVQEADDLTQQFFAMLLERKDLDELAPERGTVRGFLKVALRHFLAKNDRSARARPFVIPFDDETESIVDEPALSPEEAFDRAWVDRVIGEALNHLRRQLHADGREVQMAIFETYCLTEEGEITYDELARRFAMKPEDARNRVRDARRRMMDILRGLVAEYVGPGRDVDAEVAFVLGR